MTDSRLKIDIRRKRILEQLRLEGKVSVSALCDALGVTPVTIRNDLTMLEQEGRLIRVQGGAVRMPTETAIPESQGIPQLARKQAIGQTVAQMVADGDTLFINSGTTCEIVAAQLSIRRNLNIVTAFGDGKVVVSHERLNHTSDKRENRAQQHRAYGNQDSKQKILSPRSESIKLKQQFTKSDDGDG